MSPNSDADGGIDQPMTDQNDVDLSSVTDEQVDEIYEEIRESFDLAMKSEGVGEDTRERVISTVDDAVGNHF